MISPFFVGYETLEEWAKAADKTRPVYALPIQDQGKTSNEGFRVDDLTVFVSQLEAAQAAVHYVSLHVSSLQFMDNVPWNDDHEGRRERFNQVWNLVSEWLAREGFTVRSAIVARPNDLRLLSGWADFIAYDKAEKRYYYRTDLASAEPRKEPEEKPQKLKIELGEGDELSDGELTIARWIKDDNQGIADVNKIALQFNLSGGAIIDLLKRWYWMDLLTEVEKPKENGRRLTEKMLILL